MPPVYGFQSLPHMSQWIDTYLNASLPSKKELQKKPHWASVDIDDTVIRSSGGSKPIKCMIELVKGMKQRGMKIAIITARPDGDDQVSWTEGQLKEHDIPYDKLVLMPRRERRSHNWDDAVGVYKERERRKLLRDGGKLVLTLGDGPGDHQPRSKYEALRKIYFPHKSKQDRFIYFFNDILSAKMPCQYD